MTNLDENLPAAVRLQWSARTDRGKVRKNNEDTFLCLQFDAQEVRFLGKTGEGSTRETDFIFAVSDGMGGAQAGEFASRITVDKITHLLPRSFKRAASGLEEGFGDLLAELYDQIHRTLLFMSGSYPECSGMGATLSLCWFTPGRMVFGHIGDTRIYYLPYREGGMRQLTQDDTHVGWLYRNGQINERQARDHPRRTVLQKALGAGHQFVDPQVGIVPCEPGDFFLLCTDGLVDGLFDYQFLELLRSGGEPTAGAAHRLVDAALERAGRDNTTALVVEVLA